MKVINKLKLVIVSLVVLLSIASTGMAYEYYVPYYDMSMGVHTGIALTNMSQATAHVTLKYY